jgi:hypothetical protein
MAGYIWYKMRQIKRVLLQEQAERRKARLAPVLSGDDGEVVNGGSSGWILDGTQQGLTQRGREYEALAQEEADIGVASTTSLGEELPRYLAYPQYRADLEYQGAGRDQVGRERVREQTWV